jgi:2-keto-3-deoxy-L-rhamnonate aldolase RhmA
MLNMRDSLLFVIPGLTPIVRVPDHQYTYVSHSLDAGAQGIMFPRIYSVAEVKKCVAMTLYPPLGIRGNALNRGHTTYQGGVSLSEAMEAHNAETFIIIQVRYTSLGLRASRLWLAP